MSEVFRHLGIGEFPSTRELTRLFDAVSGLLKASGVQYFVDSRGVHVRRTPSASTINGAQEIVYCKVDAPDADEIDCYPDAMVDEWSAATTYGLDKWCVVSGTEYRSLQADNTNHLVTDGDWWVEGVVSITIKCIIINGTSLMYAGPPLHKGDPIIVGKLTVDGSPTWYCTNIEFNGATFMP